MLEIKHISKHPHLTKTPANGKSHPISGFITAIFNFLGQALRLFPTKTNPFADRNGHPRKGYRKQFFEFELKKRERYLNTLPEDTRNEIVGGRRAFFERMQS